MTARPNAGFSLIELLISMLILSTLAAIAIPNLLQSRNRAHDAVTKGYLRNVVTGVEIKRTGDTFAVPRNQSCAALAGKPTDPASVSECSYTPAPSQDSYTVTVESITGETYRYDGAETSVLP